MVADMYKKMLMLIITALLVLSVAQPAMAVQGEALAAWQPLNDLRLHRTKTVVLNGIDAAIGVLKAADNGIGRSKLTDGQKAELKAHIGSNITWFEGKKQEVKSSKDIPGALQYARQASDRWNVIYPGLKKEIGLMSCDNFDVELNRARSAAAIASSRISALKAQGKDTGSLEGSLASYNGHVDSASQRVAAARSDFNAISAPNDGHFATGLRQLGSAEKESKSAYSDLKAIYRQLLGDSVKIT